ncbi:gp26 base plate hub subunit [Delftia phage PhiW-14]|uniref:Gp26 base plate hub subunit n=1 Tax=Delftia phage PhiW-14 TaxID=665032 RepID=C9DG00_BPW14|nr:gp26 base plate hub subunit [Delftia phage PhiW-14]ACV50051.1 gp26 base plate hub subunit [Delftia phage PhiW-14]
MVAPLPIIPLPTFTVEDPDLPGGSARFKPFTLGLESILLQAKGMNDKEINIKDAIEAVHQVIDACAVDPDFDSRKLPTWVVELVFTRLRQHSIGEIIPLNYICKTDVEVKEEGSEEATQKPCNTKMSFALDLRELSVERGEYTNKFVVHDDPEAPIAVSFKHMGLSVASTEHLSSAHLLASLVDTISHGDEVFKASDYTPEQLLAFTKSITSLKKEEIHKKYLGGIPTIRKKISMKCPNCGTEHTLELEGIKDFFG